MLLKISLNIVSKRFKDAFSIVITKEGIKPADIKSKHFDQFSNYAITKNEDGSWSELHIDREDKNNQTAIKKLEDLLKMKVKKHGKNMFNIKANFTFIHCQNEGIYCICSQNHKFPCHQKSEIHTENNYSNVEDTALLQSSQDSEEISAEPFLDTILTFTTGVLQRGYKLNNPDSQSQPNTKLNIQPNENGGYVNPAFVDGREEEQIKTP